MTYLTAHRSQSRKYGDAGKAFKTPAPYKPPTKPLGANDNTPKPANDNLRKLALTAKGQRYLRYARINPLVNVAVTLTQTVWPYSKELDIPPGGTQCCFVPRVGPITGAKIWNTNGTCPAACPALQNAGSNSVGAGVPFSGAGNLPNPGTTGWQLEIFRPNPSFPNLRVDIEQAIAYPGLYPIGWVLRRPIARPIHKPYTISPHLLPIQQPMPLPLPLPMPLVNQRLNDPIGSQRNNGQKRQVFDLRRPPGPNEKERKVRAIAGAVALLQKAMHFTTEALDALDAIHDALPKELQAKGFKKDGRYWKATPQSKLEAIAKNFDKLDLNEAVKNLIVNHLTDEVIGRVSGAGSREGSKRGLMLGPSGSGIFFG